MTELTPEEAATVERFDRAPDALAEDLRDEVADPSGSWANRSAATHAGDAIRGCCMTTEQAARASTICPTCGAMPTYRCRTRTFRRLVRCHRQRILTHLAEQGRLLASERDDLIATRAALRALTAALTERGQA